MFFFLSYFFLLCSSLTAIDAPRPDYFIFLVFHPDRISTLPAKTTPLHHRRATVNLIRMIQRWDLVISYLVDVAIVIFYIETITFFFFKSPLSSCLRTRLEHTPGGRVKKPCVCVCVYTEIRCPVCCLEFEFQLGWWEGRRFLFYSVFVFGTRLFKNRLGVGIVWANFLFFFLPVVVFF